MVIALSSCRSCIKYNSYIVKKTHTRNDKVIFCLFFSFNDNNLLYNNAYDEAEVERKHKIAQSTAHVIVGRLKDFHEILLDPPKVNNKI